jgi:hypothetical protein
LCPAAACSAFIASTVAPSRWLGPSGWEQSDQPRNPLASAGGLLWKELLDPTSGSPQRPAVKTDILEAVLTVCGLRPDRRKPSHQALHARGPPQ